MQSGDLRHSFFFFVPTLTVYSIEFHTTKYVHEVTSDYCFTVFDYSRSWKFDVDSGDILYF